MWPMNSQPAAKMWPDASPSAPTPTLPSPCILKSRQLPLRLTLSVAQLRITRSGIRQEFPMFHRKLLLPKVLATSATFKLATSATPSLAKFHFVLVALILFLLTAGCGPAAAPPQVHINRSNQAAQQAAAHWDEQVRQVLAGDSDTLVVEAEPITAPQLSQLPTLDGKLSQLLIEAGGVDDEALQTIAQVRSLVHLRLRECPIGNAGLAKLVEANMSELQILNIPQTQCTAEGIAQLASLPKLIQLRLGGQQIDDRAVAEIAKLPKLRSLHLIGPTLSDSALEKLSSSPLLSTFYLDDCPLSDAAWQQLFTAKPKLHVHIDQAHHDRDPNQHD
jgi:hypothetical protein